MNNTLKYLMYRKNISFKSGTGQLIRMQAEHFRKNSLQWEVFCSSGRLKALFKLKSMPKKAKVINSNLITNKNHFIIDHDASLLNSDMTFIHNISDEMLCNAYFNQLNKSQCHIISNSKIASNILIKNNFNPNKISIVYPGYNDKKFNEKTKILNREKARKLLSFPDENKVIGFITSGDFKKRGLDRFIEICERLNNTHENLSFFIMGAKSLPKKYINHPLLKSSKLVYKKRNNKPEFWLSSIDIFLYPALFEEFGMVIPEAMALGIPILTTRNVGASEILPKEYDNWIANQYDEDFFIQKISTLINNKEEYTQLVKASLLAISYNSQNYAERVMSIINDISKREKP
ncbi:glycosyltransferase family 4 protein [Vibrio gangliei]|uniref:glycosyltransferase family 4 protein n=1 Tax=Vibrio gangliei TaxID=2077090 RepID=UPI0013007DD9|nr:glycosyltransferase family 4 protein [Vibrio gangliei]